MLKPGSDPKVKKTLVRNCEKRIKPSVRKPVVHDVCSTAKDMGRQAQPGSSKENELSHPTLCSSEALAQYLSGVKISAPPPSTAEDLNVDKGQICSKMTKKLNFHFNDRMYRNLIELNANVQELKRKKDKRPSSGTSNKRDLEPNIEDFCEEIKDKDTPPNIPVIKPKFKAVKKVESGHLHKLVAAFEDL